MKRRNMNDFARELTLDEAGKVQVNIAQVKEILRRLRAKTLDENGVDLYAVWSGECWTIHDQKNKAVGFVFEAHP